MTAAPTPMQVISPTPFTTIRLPGHRLSRRRGYTPSASTGLRTARHLRCGITTWKVIGRTLDASKQFSFEIKALGKDLCEIPP
jgi:hypothetical protein